MAARQTKRKRPRYDDKFRASAVVMLKSQGYPATEGALTFVAKHLKVPAMTLSRWFRAAQNPPPNELVTEKEFDMRTAIQAEMQAIVKAFPNARADAPYRELGTVYGILFDKARLLDGLPTAIVAVLPELVQALEDIDLDAADVFNSMLAKAKAQREAMNADR